MRSKRRQTDPEARIVPYNQNIAPPLDLHLLDDGVQEVTIVGAVVTPSEGHAFLTNYEVEFGDGIGIEAMREHVKHIAPTVAARGWKVAVQTFTIGLAMLECFRNDAPLIGSEVPIDVPARKRRTTDDQLEQWLEEQASELSCPRCGSVGRCGCDP